MLTVARCNKNQMHWKPVLKFKTQQEPTSLNFYFVLNKKDLAKLIVTCEVQKIKLNVEV